MHTTSHNPPATSISAIAWTSIIAIGSTGAFMIIAMPGVLLALSDKIHLSAGGAARIATSELFGMLISTLLLGQLLATQHRKVVVAIALFLLCLGNIVSIFLMHSSWLFTARIVCGLGEGLTLAAMGAAAAAVPNPDRLFAAYMASNLVVVTVFLSGLSRIIAFGGLTLMFLILGAVGLVGIAALPAFPGLAASGRPQAGNLASSFLSAVTNRSAVIGLIASLIFCTGIGVVWPLMGQIGISRAIPSGSIASALGLAPIGGVAAGVCATLLGLRIGRRLPLIVGGAALILTMTILAADGWTFAACAVSFMFWWVFVTAFFMGTIASADPTGRAGVLIPATQQGGLAAGPILGALLAGSGSFALPIAVGTTACLVGLFLAIYSDSLTKAYSRHLQPS